MPTLAAITDDEWKAITSRLTLYAHGKMRPLRWRGCVPAARTTGPGGTDAGDVAATAIERVLSGVRAWDDRADPYTQLCAVVDSLISHLVRGWENRRQRMMPTVTRADGSEHQIDPAGREPDPAQAAADAEEAAAYRAAVRAAVAQDPLAAAIFECLIGGFSTPAEMAELIGVEVEQIYTAKRRLCRAVDGVMGKPRKSSRSDKGARHARPS